MPHLKNIIFVLTALLFSVNAFSQNIPPVEGIKLETGDDYRNADQAVKEVSQYLLIVPVNKESNTRVKAGYFLLKWMEGTPEFNFTFNHSVLKYFEKDVDLLAIYYGAMASFALQYPSVKNPDTITLNAVKTLIAYVNNSHNHVIAARPLKKTAGC